ncbi:MAG: anti-sigma factor family protein [Tepidisphaeraceae bacterium]
MSVNETDLELLETWLDDELSQPESDALRRRLSSEPELACAMDQLRAERDTRQTLFRALEPNDQSVDSLVRSVRASIVRDLVWAERARKLRFVSSAAACLLFGVFAGWFGRGLDFSAPQQPVARNTVSSEIDPEPGQIVFPPVVNASRGMRTAAPARRGRFNVTITDDLGRVIGVQPFDTLDEAREFTNDLGKWQSKQRQIRGGNTVLIKDQF